MTYDEFLKAYFFTIDLAIICAEKTRREGLLSLEDKIDTIKANNREIFEYGMQFVIDGTDIELIDDILSRVIVHEKDPNKSLLMKIEKEAVLAIASGCNPRLMFHLLSSYVDIPLSDPRYRKLTENQ